MGALSYLLVCFPKVHKDRDWAVLKPGAGNSMWVSHMGGRDLTTRLITCCLLRCTLGEAATGSWALTRTQVLKYGTQRHPGWHLNCYAKRLLPVLTINITHLLVVHDQV